MYRILKSKYEKYENKIRILQSRMHVFMIRVISNLKNFENFTAYLWILFWYSS
jgi:hypothetical protein